MGLGASCTGDSCLSFSSGGVGSSGSVDSKLVSEATLCTDSVRLTLGGLEAARDAGGLLPSNDELLLAPKDGLSLTARGG